MLGQLGMGRIQTTVISIAMLAVACKSKPEPVAIGPVAQPFGLVAGVTFGMTVDDVKRVAPKLEIDPKGTSAHNPYDQDDRYEVFIDNGRVSGMTIQLMHRAADEVWKAWGPGTVLKAGLEERHRYFDEPHGIRADVTAVGPSGASASTAFRYSPFVPFAKLLDGPDAYSFAGVSMLGRPIADVTKDFEARHYKVKQQGSSDLVDVRGFPFSEWDGVTGGPSVRTLMLFVADGKVQHWSFGNVAFEVDDAIKAKLLALYQQKWGKPTETEREYVFGTAPQVRVSKSDMGPMVTATPMP